MDVWERKHPKLLDEETRRHWRTLEEEQKEETAMHAAVRGWKEERSLYTHTSQHDTIMFDRAIFAPHTLSETHCDLQVLGQTPRRPLRILSTGFILLPAPSLALATWRAPS